MRLWHIKKSEGCLTHTASHDPPNDTAAMFLVLVLLSLTLINLDDTLYFFHQLYRYLLIFYSTNQGEANKTPPSPPPTVSATFTNYNCIFTLSGILTLAFALEAIIKSSGLYS